MFEHRKNNSTTMTGRNSDFQSLKDDDDVYFPLTHYYLQDMNHSNYLQLLPIMKS